MHVVPSFRKDSKSLEFWKKVSKDYFFAGKIAYFVTGRAKMMHLLSMSLRNQTPLGLSHCWCFWLWAREAPALPSPGPGQEDLNFVDIYQSSGETCQKFANVCHQTSNMRKKPQTRPNKQNLHKEFVVKSYCIGTTSKAFSEMDACCSDFGGERFITENGEPDRSLDFCQEHLQRH